MWWFTAVVAVAAWRGAAAEASPEPDPLLLYAALPSWAGQMFGTPQEVAQDAASAMTERTQAPSSTVSLPFRPAGLAASPLIAIRDAQAPPAYVVALRQPSSLNLQLLQRPVTFLPYPLFVPAMHLRLPFPTLPYDTRYRPPAIFYPALPANTYAHSRPAHLDEDEEDDQEDEEDVDSRPTYVRVGHFPRELAGLTSLRTAEDDGPVAPAGIAQSLMPTFTVVPFTNPKAHPSLRDVKPTKGGAVITA